MLIMRHELLLVAITVILLIVEIFLPNTQKRKIILPAILLMAAVTLIGFLPGEPGELFGGMYQSTQLTMLLKNILNIGVLIVFIQSVDWLKQDQNKEKISEFFLLILSTLIGMNYMISAGDFLMFYLGLELATIPIAALAAYERYKEKSAEAGVKLIFISALSSGILLYGLSMIYGTTGTMYFTDIAPLMNGSPSRCWHLSFSFREWLSRFPSYPFISGLPMFTKGRRST